MNNKYFLLGLLLLFVLPNTAFSAGFDCSNASSRVEKLICSDSQLSAADSKLSRLYKESKTSLPRSEVAGLRKEQRVWLGVRNKRCVTAASCLSIYQNRIDVLKIKAKWKDDLSVISPRSLYERFNMRTIFSSFGQRMKYHCNTYPFEYFKKSQMKIEGSNVLVLDNGEDVWVFKIISGNKVSISNQIKSGTYLSVEKYDLRYDKGASDWRAKEANISRATDCVFYNFESG